MKKSDQDDDADYFRQAMKDVQPLVVTPKDCSIVFKKKHETQKCIFLPADTALEDISIRNILSDEKLFFVRSGGGLQNTLLRQLKQGKIRTTQSLDLHGLIVNAARLAVSRFIKQAVIQQHRFVIIIHGKGKMFEDKPVLKNHLDYWLKQIPAVLAFCSAIPKDGGTGAVYVILKKLPFQDSQ